MDFPPKESYLIVGLNDAKASELAASAARIAALLDKEDVLKDPNVCACLDDLIGAVQALFLAYTSSFQDRSGKPIELPVLQKRAVKLADGHVRTDGAWMAGFYFNSALFRMSAVYHRVLRIVGGVIPDSQNTVADVKDAAVQRYKTWKDHEWRYDRIAAVHREVNTLKHATSGLYVTRKVGFADGSTALKQLLDLLEGWADHELPDALEPNGC